MNMFLAKGGQCIIDTCKEALSSGTSAGHDEVLPKWHTLIGWPSHHRIKVLLNVDDESE